MAVKVYESIIEKAPSLEAELCSGIGRLYLQVMYNSVPHSQASPSFCSLVYVQYITPKQVHVYYTEHVYPLLSLLCGSQ